MPFLQGYFVGGPATPGGEIVVVNGAGGHPGFGDNGNPGDVTGVVKDGTSTLGVGWGGSDPPAATRGVACTPVAAGRVFFSFALDSLTDLAAACAENAASDVASMADA